MRNSLTRTLIATVAFACAIAANILANALPINGMTTGAVSNLYPNLFTPAGFTFSIWSVIYLSLTSFVVFAYLKPGRQLPVLTTILPWFTLSSILNASWITAWHFLLPALSFLIMIGLLVTLTRIFTLIQQSPITTPGQFLFITLPFTLYFAWICVATIANASALLVHWKWTGGPLSPETWTIIMMIAAAAIAVVIVWRYRSWPHVAVTVWAIFGINSKAGREVTLIHETAIFLMVILAALLIFCLVRPHTFYKTHERTG